MSKNFNNFCQSAKKLGVKRAIVIPTDYIVTAEWVRLKCQYGCDGYGESLTCPPYTPTPEQTKKILREFKKAILVQTDEYTDIREIVIELEKEIFLQGYYKTISFAAGPCNLCRSCETNKACKHPYKTRPSLEACGIDVYQTVRNSKLKIEVVKDYSCQANYFGLVLVE